MALDKEDIKQLIAILQKGLSDDESSDEPKPKSRKRKTKQPTQSNNKFIEMGFDRLHKEDIEIDKMLKKGPPTPRRRKLSQIEVRCRVCGRKETINPSLLYESPDRYKCNKCCSSPG